MRYYRLGCSLTACRLADNRNIAPATGFGCEQGRVPIPYDIAVTLSEIM